MIGIKHFMDAPQGCDGKRIWIEPPGLTRDLREWCRVDYVLTELGPPAALIQWFTDHPRKYRTFCDRYLRHLVTSGRSPALLRLGRLASRENVTLLHSSDHADRNTAAALRDIVSGLCGSQSDDRSSGLRHPSPDLSTRAIQHASRRTPEARARASSPSCEVGSTIYQWQIMTDEPQVRRFRHEHQKSFRHFLIACVRHLKGAAQLIHLARRQRPER